jgi:NAD(P)-dependent dehydrogenase (short-subunit alcohol dehydrogenase family)
MTRTAVIAGVGPGLGESIARRFVAEGCRVALLARTAAYVEGLADDLGAAALAVPTDLTEPGEIEAAFATVREAFGPVDVLVNHASGGAWKGARDLSLAEFEHAWQVGARAGLQCSQEALDDMLGGGDSADDTNDADDTVDGGGGTIVFTGATSAIRGRGGAAAFSSAKFAVRGLAESMAREFGPQGVHVAHVVIDGGILPPGREVANPEEYLDPDAIADSYWHLVQQDRSAWTLELDLRPHVEEF